MPAAAFAGSPKSLRVSARGRFSYRFVAPALSSGKIRLVSARKVKVGSNKRTLKLGPKTFAAPDTANVIVRFQLSRTQLKALRRVKRLRFTITVALGARTFTAPLTLRAPRR